MRSIVRDLRDAIVEVARVASETAVGRAVEASPS
jgi:hypothetical protein